MLFYLRCLYPLLLLLLLLLLLFKTIKVMCFFTGKMMFDIRNIILLINLHLDRGDFFFFNFKIIKN